MGRWKLPGRRTGGGEHEREARAIVVAGIRANPVVVLADEGLMALLDDPEADLDLDGLGFDSLARLEFAVHLDAEHGIAVTVEEIEQHRTLTGLTRLVAGRR